MESGNGLPRQPAKVGSTETDTSNWISQAASAVRHIADLPIRIIAEADMLVAYFGVFLQSA